MKQCAKFIVLAFVIQFGSPLAAIGLDRQKLLDVQIGDQWVSGRVLTHNDELCWLMQRNGHLRQIEIRNVTDFKERDQRFQVNSRQEIQQQLETEFGANFEVRTTAHYVVVARKGVAESYAALFERIYFEFMRLFRAKGLHVVEAEFPLVAVVLPDEERFVAYCQREKTRVQRGLVGFYLPTSNRVAMYERPLATNLDATVIHEATHQMAFNTGVHSRLARHPRWVVEGLATVLEAEGIRSRTGTVSPADRINRERYLWFIEYAKTRRPAHSLKAVLSDDSLFQTSVLDAYSEAWALSFFLIETAPKEYSNYLRKLVERDPLTNYDVEQRVKDFTETFGSDLDRVEASYLRFIQKIARH